MDFGHALSGRGLGRKPGEPGRRRLEMLRPLSKKKPVFASASEAKLEQAEAEWFYIVRPVVLAVKGLFEYYD